MCNCGNTSSNPQDAQQYVVTRKDGTKKVVSGEHAAKVEVTMYGGTYSKV